MVWGVEQALSHECLTYRGFAKMIGSCLIMWSVLLVGQLWFVMCTIFPICKVTTTLVCDMQFEDIKAQQIMWTKLNETMLKHGFPKLNFEGFMANSAQTNQNVIKIIYVLRDPFVKMVDKEPPIYSIEFNHLINTSNIN